jgi:hypothetical protein
MLLARHPFLDIRPRILAAPGTDILMLSNDKDTRLHNKNALLDER